MSHSRGLIKSMLLIGSAQVVNILLLIFRVKVVAVLLGPSGVGLLSIYNSALDFGKQTAGLGIGSSGVREIASSRGEQTTLSQVRRVLILAHLIQGILAIIAVWLLRDRIAIWIFGDPMRAGEVGLIGIAILFSLLASAQTALLQGLRQIGDLGRVTVFGAFAGTLVGLAAVWVQGEKGLIWFVLVQPLASVLVALHYTSRIPKLAASRMSAVKTWTIWKPMATLGVAFMLGGLATAATLLVVRSRILQELGLDAAGHFAAAWGITMTYVGFLLGAMSAEYYPRLTEVIGDKVTAVQLMNDQAQLGLAIGGPVLLLLIGLAPLVITMLYSAEFGPAATLVQWQTVGNIFKIASWALGFSLAASARSKTFLLVQVHFNILFLLILWPTLTYSGIIAAGPAFSIAYLLHFCLLNFLVRRNHGFRWHSLSLGLLGLHTGLALGLLILALLNPFSAAVVAPILAAATALFGLRIVLSKIGMHGRLPTRLYAIFARFGWPIKAMA